MKQALSRTAIAAGLVWTLWATLGTSPAWAAPDAAFDKAFVAFNRAGAEGGSSAVDEAATAFEALRQSEPANPVLLAYAGASLAMRAGTTMLPWKKMSYAEDGMAEIDKALSLLTPAHDAPVQHGTPGVLEVKFVAANTFLAVPGFMNRAARGRKLLDEVLASPLLATAPLSFRGAVWLRAAKVAAGEKRGADARKWIDEMVRHGAPQADAAKALLKEIGA